MDIKGFEIYNFQSHEKTIIDLKGGINVFVGTSNSGKSAILRALKWNLMNTPSGNEFIRKGTKEAKVIIHFTDGHSVERKRSTGSINTYALLKDGVVLEEYTGFGSKVPSPILEVTKFDPNFAFNFANQLDAPFLLADTPRVRAETIGNLEELGKIDAGLGEVNNDVRGIKEEQRSTQKQMKELEEERNSLLEEINSDKEKMATLSELKEAVLEKQQVYEVIAKSSERIEKLNFEMHELREVVNRAERILKNWNEDLPSAVENFRKSNQILSRLLELKNEATLINYMNEDKLERLISLSSYVSEIMTNYQQLVRVQQKLEWNDGEVKRLKNSYSPAAASLDIKPIDLEVERFSAIFTRSRRIQEIQELKQEMAQQANQSSQEIDNLLTKFVEALHEAQTCPTCFQTTDNLSKHELEHSL